MVCQIAQPAVFFLEVLTVIGGVMISDRNLKRRKCAKRDRNDPPAHSLASKVF